MKSVLNIHWKDWCWSWNSNTLATWCEELTHWKRPWCWERLKAGREGDDRGWDGWMASPTPWTWVWGSSSSWWWTGKPGMLQSMGSQRVGQDWATELTETWIWTYLGGNLQNKKFSWSYMGLFSLKMLHYFCHFKSKLHKRKKCNHTKESKQQNDDLWENIYNFTSQRTNMWKVLQIWDKRQNPYRKKKLKQFSEKKFICLLTCEKNT